jgi:hypothetical protein
VVFFQLLFSFRSPSVEVAIVGDQVGGLAPIVANLGARLLGKLDDAVPDGLWVGEALEGHKVGSQAGYVGAGHAGSAENIGSRVALDAAAQNVDARGKDVDASAKVGEAGTVVCRLVDSANRNGEFGRAGRSVPGVLVLVTSSHNRDDTGVEDGVDGRVEGPGHRTAKRHVHDGLATKASGGGVGNHEIHARKDARVGSRAILVQHLDSNQLDVLSHTVCLAPNSARNVGAVAVLIRVLSLRVNNWLGRTPTTVACTYHLVDEVLSPDSPTLEFAVGDPDACVHHIRRDTLPGSVVKYVAP